MSKESVDTHGCTCTIRHDDARLCVCVSDVCSPALRPPLRQTTLTVFWNVDNTIANVCPTVLLVMQVQQSYPWHASVGSVGVCIVRGGRAACNARLSPPLAPQVCCGLIYGCWLSSAAFLALGGSKKD